MRLLMVFGLCITKTSGLADGGLKSRSLGHQIQLQNTARKAGDNNADTDVLSSKIHINTNIPDGKKLSNLSYHF